MASREEDAAPDLRCSRTDRARCSSPDGCDVSGLAFGAPSNKLHPSTVSAIVMGTGSCKAIFYGQPCPCLAGKFENLSAGQLSNAHCSECGHAFELHDTTAANLWFSEDPTIQRSPAKRARVDSDVPSPTRAADPHPVTVDIFNPVPLGSDVYLTSGDQNIRLSKGQSVYDFITQPSMLFADKTKYIEILDRDSHYNYMFLRPRRFGKSTFLNTLCTYYDIAQADIFEKIFGGLYIGKNPTPFHNRHLVLKLDLSTIGISGGMFTTRRNFNSRINFDIRSFLTKYQGWLGGSGACIPADIIEIDNATDSLLNLLALVKKSNQTLFVGIDEYDAPANNALFDGRPSSEQSKQHRIGRIEAFFKESLFSVLKEAFGTGPSTSTACISKYFLTGVLPAFRAGMSPVTATTLISGKPEFHGICGFTEEQVKLFAEAYFGSSDLHPDLTGMLSTMKKYYNGYCFTTNADETLKLVYNPQLVSHYLSNATPSGSIVNPVDSEDIHNVNILTSIADSGQFSMKDIVELMATGRKETDIHSEFGFVDLIKEVGKKKVATLSLLVYTGGLTRDIEPGFVRIPNEVMKIKVLERIKNFISAQEHLQSKLGSANENLRQGSIGLFVELLEGFMKHRAVRSLYTTDEATLQGVVEMALDPPGTRVGELCLVMDGTKQRGDGRFGFADVFVVDDNGDAVILELKDIRLSGLISGSQKRWTPHPPSKEMQQMSKTVTDMDEESLNAMPYMYWSKEANCALPTTVGETRKDALTQLERYMQVAKLSTVEGRSDSGILDGWVKTVPGNRSLYGFVLMAVGGRRVLWQAAETVGTQFFYKRAIS